MPDKQYWKDRYKQTWADSEKKEKYVVDRLKSDTGLEAVVVGFGAGSTEYIRGAAVDHGYEKGDADLQIVGTNHYLEVTGPFSSRVSRADPLWIRPDKIENAKNNLHRHTTFLIHVLASTGEMRVIALDASFMKLFDRGEFKVVSPSIRGSVETYIEVPAGHAVVWQWNNFCEHIIGSPGIGQ